MERPPDVRYRKPVGQVGHGLTAPAGYVLGRNCCIRFVPLAPRYVAATVSDAGRSRWIEACQFCAVAGRKFGSTEKVLMPRAPACWKPLASVSGFAGVLAMLNVVESGGCCASSVAID